MPIKTRPRLVASSPSTTKLFVDDLREIAALARAENRSNSNLIRELVHEALRMRRLRVIGRDEGEDYVRRIYQEAIADGVAPMTEALTELRRMTEQSSAEARSGAAKLNETRANLVAQLLQRMVATESMVRVLMTIEMQKDNRGPEEIKKHLLGHEDSALRQTRELMKQILGDQSRTHDETER
ncbi:MAG: hypothetical protein ACREEM_09720 [Blastocatellia bacterium]